MYVAKRFIERRLCKSTALCGTLEAAERRVPDSPRLPLRIASIAFYFDRKYLLGAPGVGTLLATCAPLACAWVNAVVRVMPEPETCAPAACADLSGAAMVMVALPPPLPPPVVAATTAVSWFAPLSMVMVWPAVKPAPLPTGITVAPTPVAAPTVVAPAVPTVAMTAVSRLAAVSMIIVCPAAKSATLATLILVAPAADAADTVLAACNRKSLQLLSVSAPSGKRPELL